MVSARHVQRGRRSLGRRIRSGDNDVVVERRLTCKLCGVEAGPGSRFKKGLCAECQKDLVRRRGNRSGWIHAVVIASAAYIIVTGVDVPISIPKYLILALAFFDLTLVLMTVIHELAHAVMVLVNGFELVEVSIGVGPKLLSTRIGATRLIWRLYPVSGHTIYLPFGSNSRAKMFALTASGPLSHIPLAAWLFTLETGNEIFDILLGIAPEIILIQMLLNVVPVFENDGRSLIRIFRLTEAELSATQSEATMTKQLQPIFAGDHALVSQEQRKAVMDHLAEIGHDPRSRALSLNNLAAVDILIDDPGLVEEADEASRQAYETLPDVAAIRNTRGAALIAMGQFQAGIDLLEPTLGKTPPESLADSHLSLAHAHISLGRVYEGRNHLHAAEPTHIRPRLYESMLAALGRLEVAVIRQFDANDPAESANMFRQQAGGVSVTTGRALLFHIEETGNDSDLERIARMLASR